MRKSRWIFWGVSLGICFIILFLYDYLTSSTPYDERTPINVCCPEQFQSQVKKVIEKNNNFKKNSRVVFTQDEKEADFVITNKVTKSDTDYEKIGYTPLIVALDEEKIKEYTKQEYLKKENNAYTLNFSKILTDTLQGNYTDKIYCPDLNTREGELFYDFLLITFNGGTYPTKAQDLETYQKKADEFFENACVVQTNTEERIRVRKVLHNEIDFIFENIIFPMVSDDFEFEISYPENTVIYEYFCKFQGKNKELLEKCMYETNFLDNLNSLENIMKENYFRRFNASTYPGSNFYSVSKGFSYIEIPVKE